MLAQAGRLQSRQRFFNLVVTNVPGPQMPLYVLGRQLSTSSRSPRLPKRQAVCIAIMSYNGKLNFGLLGDFDTMPDLEVIAGGISSSLDELRLAAGLRKKSRAPRRRATAVLAFKRLDPPADHQQGVVSGEGSESSADS